jgi:outer membrane protein
MKKLAVFMLSLFLLFTQVHGQATSPVRVIDLEELIAICLTKNFDVRSARERISARIQRIRKAEAALLPSVNFSGAYTRIGVVPKFEIPGFEDIEFVNPDSLNFSLGVQYNLFDWGMSRERVRIEKLGLESERLSTVLMQKGFGLQLAVLYVNIRQIEESEAVIRDNITILQDILKVLQEKYDQGYAPEHQLLQTRTAIENLNSRQLELRTARTEMVTTLKNVAGIDLAADVTLLPIKREDELLNKDVAGLLAKAAEEREDFQVLQLQLEILEKTQKIVSRSRRPLLSASLHAELRNGIMPEVEKLKTNWNVGLSVVYNLFDGHAARSERQALDHQIREFQFKISKLKRDVEAHIRRILDQLKLLEQMARVGQARLELAGRSLELTRQGFETGRASLLDVLEARSSFNLAQNGVIGLKYQRYIQLFNLEYECGGFRPDSHVKTREAK